MPPLCASVPCHEPPAWAVWQRRLFETMEAAIDPYTEAYCEEDGRLIYRHETAHSLDDFYEAFFNWPLLYQLGGGDHLMERAHRHFEAVTRQLTDFGLVDQEYAVTDDQFHQAESDIFFYNLCLADPGNDRSIERAARFADFYTGHDPRVDNWDPQHRIIRSAYNGSGGARLDFYGDDMSYGWSAGMAVYGLPHYDVPGVETAEDLKDPTKARAMGQTMARRMGRGDSIANLHVTSLVTNAYLLTGEDRYRRWLLDYTEAWIERANANDGLLPDNVGLNGQVGETMDGKWFGGLYGWTWPHGFYNIQQAALVAAANAQLVTGDSGYLDLPRRQHDRIMALGERRDMRQSHMSLEHHWIGQWRALEKSDTYENLLVPYRIGDAGWFDWQPMSPIYPATLWSLSQSTGDWQRLEDLRSAESYDWREVISFRNKEDAGHEQPWLRFLAGVNPTAPERISAAAYGEVCRRMDLIRDDDEAATHADVHRWQHTNPVSTEALVQQTLGAPQTIYNGGLLHARVRYADRIAQRPGLPPDVAALVSDLKSGSTTVTLVNLSALHERRLAVRAGALGEHRFGRVRYDRRRSDYPGPSPDYAAESLQRGWETQLIDDVHVAVDLPPGMQITLELETHRYANTSPSAGLAWPPLDA